MKTLEIIQYFEDLNPDLLWFFENPATGKLKERPCVQGLSFCDVTYCSYGGFGFKKPTHIWTNSDFVPRPFCRGDCAAPTKGKAHWFMAQRGGYRHKDGSMSPGFTQDQLHQLPPALCAEIFSVCQRSGMRVRSDP